MLVVGVLHGNAYGVSIKHEIESRAERKVSVGALQVALKRLEGKGYLKSRIGESSQARAGRPKRYYEVTAYGETALSYARDMRNELWITMQQMKLDPKFVI